MRAPKVLIPLAVVAVAVFVAVIAAAGGGDSAGAKSSRASAPASLPGPIPTRSKPVEIVEPGAGDTGDDLSGEDVAPRASAEDERPAKAASTSGDDGVDLTKQRAMRISADGVDHSHSGKGVDGNDVVRKATVVGNGVALPPLDAPDEVRSIIEAGNSISRTPYIWGGGHGKWLDKGYDCSGSVSFALASAGLLGSPMASGPLMSWGKKGPGKWITIYANESHVFMVVAGIRFDTSGRKVTGSRWQNSMRTEGGFVARHPPGL